MRVCIVYTYYALVCVRIYCKHIYIYILILIIHYRTGIFVEHMYIIFVILRTLRVWMRKKINFCKLKSAFSVKFFFFFFQFTTSLIIQISPTQIAHNAFCFQTASHRRPEIKTVLFIVSGYPKVPYPPRGVTSAIRACTAHKTKIRVYIIYAPAKVNFSDSFTLGLLLSLFPLLSRFRRRRTHVIMCTSYTCSAVFIYCTL